MAGIRRPPPNGRKLARVPRHQQVIVHQYLIPAILAAMLNVPIEGVTVDMPETTNQSEAAAVIAAEDEWTSAELSRDEATLRRVIDDQFVFNGNDGEKTGKEDLIRSVLGWNMTGQTVSERSVVVTGDTAVTFGTTELRFASPDGSETASLLRYTATWVKRGGQWRALALHMGQRLREE